jgi:hypothetical protein
MYAPTPGYSRFPFSAFPCLFLRRPFADFDSFLFSGVCALYVDISITVQCNELLSLTSYSEFSYRQALSDIALSSYMAFSQSSHLQITVQYRSQDVQRSVLTFCLPMPLQAFSFYLPHLRLFPHLPHFQRHFRCNQFRCIGIVPQGLASVWHPSPVNTLAL